MSETAAEPPQDEANSLNSHRNLALEATFINHKFSQQVLKGIKIVISGRLNNKPRSKSSVSILGNIPTVTKTNELIDYSENTCYTKNGTFGIKVWCNHL